MKKKDPTKILIIAEAVVLLVAVIIILIKVFYIGNAAETDNYTLPAEVSNEVSVNEIEMPSNLYAEEEEEMAEEPDPYSMEGYPEEAIGKLAEMSTDQKIALLFVMPPETLCEVNRVRIAGNVFKSKYSENPVTGIIFSDKNIKSEAAGIEMLRALREWSRENTGMNLLLGYKEQGDRGPSEISDRGFNLFIISKDAENIEDIKKSAIDSNMIPAVSIAYDETTADIGEVAIITNVTEPFQITDSINAGIKSLYGTEDKSLIDEVKMSCESGEISQEALDHAAGYAVTLRLALTAIRPEESENTSAAETSVASDNGKKTQGNDRQAQSDAAKPAQNNNTDIQQKTPEMTAAEEAQKQAEALQKQMEETQKALQKQLEEAKQNAAAQSVPQ